MSSSHKEKCSWEWPAGSGNKRSRRPRSAPRLRPSSSVYSYSSRRPKPPRDSKSFKRKWRPGAPRSKSWLSPPDRRPSSWPPTERCCARCATPTRRSASPNERPRRLALRRMATAEPPEHGRSQSEENGASVATLRRGQRSELALGNRQRQGHLQRAFRLQARARSRRPAGAPEASSGRPDHRNPDAPQAVTAAGSKGDRQSQRHEPGAHVVGQQMNATETLQHGRDFARRLFEADATIEALLSGQIDAVVDSKSHTPVLLAKAQEALRESEQEYRQIVEATTDGIIQDRRRR